MTAKTPNAAARASVLPAGSVPPSDSLKPGKYTLKIVKMSEHGNNEFSLEYPNKFVRDHQAATIEELAPKITAQLRARYGVDTVKMVKVPTEIAEGAEITVEV